MKSISFAVKDASEENMLLQFARQHHIEIETENDLGFVTSDLLAKEFKEKTGYTLQEYQQSIVNDEQAAYLTLTDFKNSQAEYKKLRVK